MLIPSKAVYSFTDKGEMSLRCFVRDADYKALSRYVRFCSQQREKNRFYITQWTQFVVTYTTCAYTAVFLLQKMSEL